MIQRAVILREGARCPSMKRRLRRSRLTGRFVAPGR